jgi:glycerophosphoryl diester phosphodiesterase
MPTATPAASGTPGSGGDLLVSEVYYDTPGTDSQEEWIEIYNPTAAQIALDGYKVGDEETAGGGEGMVQFPPGSFIQPGEKLVVALQGVGFSALFGFAPDFEVSDTDPGVPDMLPYPAWGSGSLVLSNSGDEIVLLDSGDMPVDVLVYEGGVFPGVTAHPGVSTGHSLERFPPDQDTDDCSVDFIDQETPNPGT